MKSVITLFVAVCIAGWTFAQSPLKVVRERVGNPQILENWKLGELKVFDNVSVLRLEGENGFEHRTNLIYTSNKDIQRLITCKADQDNLSEQERAMMMESYLDKAPGGQVSLFFDRAEKRLADPTLFTVEVVDAYSGETVYKKVLEKEEPYYYKGGIWYFYKTLNVPFNLEREFVVKVTDSGLNKTFKFHVSVRDEEEDDETPLQNEFILLSQLPL